MLNALSPLIGAEAELGTAVSSGWAEGVDQEKISEWSKKGLELRDEMDRIAQETAAVEYGKRLRKVCLVLNHILFMIKVLLIF